MNRNKKFTAGLVAMAFAALAAREGVVLHAYPDPVTHSTPYTACLGETTGIHRNQRFTMAQCRKMTEDQIEHKYGRSMNSCLTNSAGIPDLTYVQLLSFTWNLGPGKFCHSIAPHFNKGAPKAGCMAMLPFDKAGKPLRVIPGLRKRRQEEVRLCLKGLK